VAREDEVNAAVEVEAEADALGGRHEREDGDGRDGGNRQELPAKILVHGLRGPGWFDDRILPLQPADRRLGNLDADVLRDLERDELVVHFRDGAVDAAGR